MKRLLYRSVFSASSTSPIRHSTTEEIVDQFDKLNRAYGHGWCRRGFLEIDLMRLRHIPKLADARRVTKTVVQRTGIYSYVKRRLQTLKDRNCAIPVLWYWCGENGEEETHATALLVYGKRKQAFFFDPAVHTEPPFTDWVVGSNLLELGNLKMHAMNVDVQGVLEEDGGVYSGICSALCLLFAVCLWKRSGFPRAKPTLRLLHQTLLRLPLSKSLIRKHLLEWQCTISSSRFPSSELFCCLGTRILP